MKTATACRLALAVALLCTKTAALATAPTPPAAPASPLPSANSFAVQEQVYVSRSPGSMALQDTLDIHAAKPNQIWIKDTPAQPKEGEKPSFYVSNSTSQYEYDGAGNRYVSGPAWQGSTELQQAITRVYYTSNMDILTTPYDPKRSWTKGTLGGKQVWLYAHSYPYQIKGVALVDTRRYWVDMQTGLLCRYEEQSGVVGYSPVVTRYDFTHWQINPALTAADFAWTPPIGAKQYTPPPKPVLLKVGTPAPDFTAITTDGRTVHLSDMAGKIVILDFWATWCVPCQASMPHLQKVYTQIQGQNVAVLALCVWDQRAKYDKWVQAEQRTYSFPTAFDPAGRNNATSIASHLYGVSGIPTQYVIGTDGKVAAAHAGYDYIAGDHYLEDALTGLGVTFSR